MSSYFGRNSSAQLSRPTGFLLGGPEPLSRPSVDVPKVVELLLFPPDTARRLNPLIYLMHLDETLQQKLENQFWKIYFRTL